MKRTRITRLSIAIVLIVTILATGLIYAEEATKTFEKLEDRLKYLGSLVKYIQAKYKYDITEEELMEGAYNGVFEVLDNHSNYFNPEDFESFNVDTSGTFAGIGISVGIRNDRITIIAPISGTPGDRAGLKAGDVIKYVEDIDISDYNLESAIHLMRGEKDTKVRLGIMRGNNTEMQYFDIVRDIIKVNPVEHEVIEGDIGYIRILTFNENTSENIKLAIDDLLEKDVKGFIVDVRNNPGGSLSEVVKVADYFVTDKSPIVHIEYKGERKTTYKAKREKIDKPLAVLVDGGSASASEIFAGAVQDTESGTIIGTQTYGKGTVQNVLSMTNGGGLKLTIAEYLTPDERKIDGIGLTPDIVIENTTAENKDDIKDFAPMIEDVKPTKDDKGLNVYGAQQRLEYIGYDVEVTGIMEEKTFEALKKFQESEGLYPYGTLDFTTKNRLMEMSIEVYSNGTEDLQLQKAIEIVSSN